MEDVNKHTDQLILTKILKEEIYQQLFFPLFPIYCIDGNKLRLINMEDVNKRADRLIKMF